MDLLPKKPPLRLALDLRKLEPATDAEKAQQMSMGDSVSFFKDGLRRLLKNKIAMAGFFVIVAVLLMVTIIPKLWPYTYDRQLGISQGQKVDPSFGNLKPFAYGATELAKIEGGEKVFPHIFGTDSLGRDYFIRVVYGARISLMVGFFASLIVLLIGTVYGSISGWAGGKVDLLMMRIVDIIYSLPDMLIIILLSVVFNRVFAKSLHGTVLGALGGNMISIFIVFALLYWVGMARLIRGQILSVKEQEFVLAAQSIGASNSMIIRRHLLPNCISVIIVSTTLQIPSAIFTESFLSFLGLGVSAPMPSLGSLAAEALSGVYSYTYRMIIPSLAICIIVLSLNLFGDGLRDAFDPKLRN